MVIFLVELGGGFFSHSLALLSDAGHVLTDIVALGLAWWATVQAERPADARNTYGYHRTGILAALANAVTLILIVIVIGYEAVQRFQHPQEVTPWVMFVSAAVGIAVNALHHLWPAQGEWRQPECARGHAARAGGHRGLSRRHCRWPAHPAHRWYPADPLISLFIAALIAKGAWRILRETVDILMEATPKQLNVAQLVRDMIGQPGVSDVHDLHVWSITGGMAASISACAGGGSPALACDDTLLCLNQLLQTISSSATPRSSWNVRAAIQPPLLLR